MDSEIADAAVPRWKVSNEGRKEGIKEGGEMMRDIAANNYGGNYSGVRGAMKAWKWVFPG